MTIDYELLEEKEKRLLKETIEKQEQLKTLGLPYKEEWERRKQEIKKYLPK